MSASSPESSSPDLLFGNSPSGLLGAAMETVQPDSQAVPENWEPPVPEHIAVLLPQYRIEHLIGRGGMGAVYKGRQITLNRPVAIKILPAELARNREFVARFHREAQLLASLSHQGIVTIFDFGQTSEGHLYFVMEFVDGTDLHRVIHKTKLDAELALKLTIQICEALQYAHDMGVIHRDIKPANVLVTRDGRAKLADFGLAMKPAEHTLDVPQPPQPEDFNPHDPLGIAALRITKPGTAMGTPDYAAPEVYDGKADTRSDIYALGIMLYEMLTGAPPKGYYQLPSSKAKVDVRIDRVVVKALEPDPEARYQRASEMRLAVENATKPLPGNAPPPPKPPQGKATTPPRRHPTGKPPAQTAPVQPARRPAVQNKSAGFYKQFLYSAALLLAVSAAYDSQHDWTWTRMVKAVFGFRAERKTVQRIEGEAMKVVSVTAGKVAPVDLRFSSAVWSGAAQLFWGHAKDDDVLLLELSVNESGRQRVRGVFSQSHDMAIVDVRLDGIPVNGSPFDFQAEELTVSDILDFGVFELAAGRHEVSLKIAGTHARDSVGNGSHVVGLDFIQLEPPSIAPSFASPGTDVALAARPSSSQPPNGDPVKNINSSKETPGRKSADQSLPRQTWHPRKGGLEWAQYEWETPQCLNECRVFWFDDQSVPQGECALPSFWRLLYREASGAWVPVEAKIPDAEDDKWSVVRFPAVKTAALRISVQCKEGWSAGICHWKAIAADPAEVSDPASRSHPDLFLGDLSPLHAQCGWGAYRANAYSAIDRRDGRIVCVGGKDCARYLWAHPASRYEFAIPEGYTRFTATGIGPSLLATKEPIGSYGSWSYTVQVDGKTLFKSPALKSFADRQVPIDVRFPAGSRRLTLITDPMGDGNSDHAFLAHPLLKVDSAPPANTKSEDAASTDSQSSPTSG